jgi:disulfide bond formation protein DsbB
MACQHFEKLKPYRLYFSWLLAVAMTLSSFYFGEIKHLPICNLCWYQRICIFPLALMLGIAAYQQDFSVKRYAIPLAGLAALLAFYQYLMQMIPGFAPFPVCGLGPDCADIPVEYLGFITIPLLSLVGCLAIIVLLLLTRTRRLP